MSRSPKRVTIADVAVKAGVSLSTVSRVLNGNITVDPAMAERVRAAAAELQYSASPLARSLVLGRTQTVAVVVPDLGNPTFQEILRGLSRAAGSAGYHVLVADSAESVDEERALALTTRRRTDGVVLCAPRMDDDALAATLAELSPVVVVNRDTADAPAVGADYRSAFTEILEHLYGLGHRRLVFLSGNPRSASNAARVAAVSAFTAAHVDVAVVEITCGVDVDSGARVAGEVRISGATAVLAYNDLVAMGVMGALRRDGVRIPEDISVAGFDDIPYAKWTSPTLTTASVPTEAVGARAWEAMRGLLSGDGAAPTTEWLRPVVALRESTGPAPA
ncbi:LacI family DNA-binding transcriptional regulator [Microbacterium sp. SSW1-59]|uniref:LacI family DNA-binding transcriptional regulator n=1 Tax=Microbacterium xanthum TaxID=3079794 RepID=UPI002AD25D59|nr:LacI family DNA-binding transcriptional regulator [Microbacterium sp. SSW1-59]MDZ8201057.1 LacI family DNA-binding transcriptional regulator [Microbacterium sp. SSW1-59]